MINLKKKTKELIKYLKKKQYRMLPWQKSVHHLIIGREGAKLTICLEDEGMNRNPPERRFRIYFIFLSVSK